MTIEEYTAPREETMEKDKDKRIEEDENKNALPTNGISLNSNKSTSISSKSKHSSSPMYSKHGNEKMEDDPFRSKASWIVDFRSETDWDNFMHSNEDQGLLTIAEVYFDWAGPCHAMTRYLSGTYVRMTLI